MFFCGLQSGFCLASVPESAIIETERVKTVAEKWKINPPVLQETEDAYDLTALVEEAISDGEDLRGKRFADEQLDFVDGQALDIVGCVFERCTFGEIDLKRISFVDCVFEKCEWSNVRLTSATFQRVKFVNCRMTGMEFLRGVLMNASFESCMMDYVSLSETKLDRAVFSQCRMRESLWSEVRMPKIRFEGCDTTKAQWMRTPLAGVDLSSCIIDGWTISLFDLRGVKLTSAQVISLSGLLGVEIVD